MLTHIEAAMKGDRQAFERIVRQYTAMAHAVAYDKLNDVQLTEDAVQESFAEAYRHLHKLRKPEAFPGWFKEIVVRQCYRILRSRRHRDALPYEQLEQTVVSPTGVEDIVERRETQRLVRDSVASLTPGMRVAVVLFYFHGYSLAEISDFLGVAVPALKKRLFDARRRLKGAMPIADPVAAVNQLYEGGEGVLHIVNGDSVADKLRQGVVNGDILVWREIYPHGPVFANASESANRRTRAGYLEKTLGIPSEQFIQISEAQEKTLADCDKYEEIVLWFEHDLFDQTMLCHLLSLLSDMTLAKTKLSLLCIGDYPGIELFHGLGQLTAEQLGTLSGTWKPIGAKELSLGKALWQAYASPDPAQLLKLMDEDTSLLPFAHDAFEMHLERFPSVRGGVSIVERVTLETVQEGVSAPFGLFAKVTDKLHGLGMGDLEYWYVLKKMTRQPYPLLHIRGLTEAGFPGFNDSNESLRDCRVELTELGKSVWSGQQDWTEKRVIDEWYGGVHLEGSRPRWRWDEAKRTIADMKA